MSNYINRDPISLNYKNSVITSGSLSDNNLVAISDKPLLYNTEGAATQIVNNNDQTFITHTFNTSQYLNQVIVNMDSDAGSATITVYVSIDGVDYTQIGSPSTGNGDHDRVFEYPQSNVNPIKIKSFRIKFQAFQNSTFFKINYLQVFTIASIRDYNVEFNDSVLDMTSWKNSRYEGSKLIGSQVNEFRFRYNSISSKRKKTITNTEDILYAYGPKPVIEKKSTVLFIGSNIQQGEATSPTNELVEINNHSYVSIDKIIILNPNASSEKDVIEEIITKESIGEDAFLSFINDNLPEGSKTKIRLLDRAVQSNFKNNYNVKFNKGSFMKIYSYTADTSSNIEDGVFGGHGVRLVQGTLMEELYSTGLFSFGMTSASAVDLFTTDSIQVVGNFPSELSSYNEQYNLINHLNPITQSIAPPTTTGGDYEIDNSQNFAL